MLSLLRALFATTPAARYQPAKHERKRGDKSPTRQYHGGGPRRKIKVKRSSAPSRQVIGRHDCSCRRPGVRRPRVVRIDGEPMSSTRRCCTACMGIREAAL